MNGRRIDPEAMYALKFAATADADPAAIREARQETHDQLIAELGDRRRGGVKWLEFGAWDGLVALEKRGMIGPDYEDLAAYLRAHPGGRLIIAMAEGVPPS